MPHPANSDDFTRRMTPEQSALFKQMRDPLARRSASLAWHHSMGSMVLEWRQVVRGAKPGTFAELGQALKISATQLVKAARFADEYSASEAERLESEGVNWGLVVATQGVEKRARRQLFKLVTSGEQNLAELASFIQSQQRGERHAGGRPPRTPPSLELGLRQMKRMCQRWLRYHEEVWPKVCEATVRQGQTRALRKVLEEARQAIAQVEATAAKVKRSLMVVSASRRQ